MPSGWEATGEVRWSSRWAASTRCVNLLLAKNPPCTSIAGPKLLEQQLPSEAHSLASRAQAGIKVSVLL